jgi:hypothetical protein
VVTFSCGIDLDAEAFDGKVNGSTCNGSNLKASKV